MNLNKNGIRVLQSHVKERSRERLGKTLDQEDYHAVLQSIRSGEAEAFQYGKRIRYHVTLRGRKLLVSYTPGGGFLTTVLAANLTTNLGEVLRRAQS